MRAHLDTNVLVRFLTDDPPDQAARAERLLRTAEELRLADLILAEVVYVLESFYARPRTEVAVLARSIVAHPSIVTGDPGLLLRAIELYETVRLDFAEAYVAAVAEGSDAPRVVTFDQKVDRVAGVERIEP